jgi:hypothetical protein
MNSIRSIGYNAYRHLTTAFPYLRQTGQMSRIGLITPEILPAVPLGMGMLYQVGQRETAGLPPSSVNEVACLAEGVLTQTIIRRAHDIFPYIPLAVGAYEVGNADGGREKIYSALKTGILFTSGYLGVTNLGAGITNALKVLEAERILIALNRPGLRDVLQNKGTPKEFSSLLSRLRDTALKQRQIIDITSQNKRVSPRLITQVGKDFEQTQKAFLSYWNKIPLTQLSEKSSKHLLNLHRGIASYNAPYIKLLRFLNPTFGYFLGITFVGLPLSNVIGRVMNAGYTQHPDDDVNLVKPLWINPLKRIAGHFWPFSSFLR